MKNYKELYEHFEGNSELHTGVVEVEQAEKELKDALDSLIGNQSELKDALDSLIGKIARAYEIQGFCFGYDLAAMQEARI